MNELGIALTILVIVVSLVTHLSRRADAQACSTQPNVRALQVSCLAAQALGVQFYWREPSMFVPPATFATICVIVGVAGLGYASIFCDCRDEALK